MSQKIEGIIRKINEAGGKLYLVGGAVRDEIMKKAVTDEDYCVTGIEKETFEKLFPNAILRGKKFAVYDIDKREFALARKEKKLEEGHKGFKIETNKNITIEEDLKRRDITINSIAKDLTTGKYIDPFGGINDIKNKKIRMTSEAFREDPLRVYRVARFAATLEFEVEKETLEQMNLLKKELMSLSRERVFHEFRKALASNKPSIFFDTLKKADVLDVHFQEIYDLIGKIQPEKYHPEGDSYQHTMIVVDTSCGLTQKLEVRFSCLVHDLGKGTTPLEILPHHYGHEDRGEKLVSELGKRIGIPKLWEQCGKIAAKEHMRGGKFNEMTAKKQVEFIEKIAKSSLGLDGMKIVVLCDKFRNEQYPEDIIFDILGNECIQSIDGKFIMQKYHMLPGIELKDKLHEERVVWMKDKLQKYIYRYN